MPGQPKMRALEIAIAALPDGEDTLFERIADGEFIKPIAASLGTTRPMIYLWISKREGRKKKFEVAKEIASHSYVEDGQIGLDAPLNPLDHPGEPGMRKSRAEYRKWLAGVRNRKEYGPKEQGPLVNFNLGFGGEHLDALKKFGNARALKGTPVPDHADSGQPLLLPAEIVSDED